MPKTNVFLIDYPQDLDLLAPILRQHRRLPMEVRVSTHALARSPRIVSELNSLSISWKKVPRFFLENGWADLKNAAAFVSACESNLKPHRAAYRLALKCRRLGIPSFTLQHGFENIGISYFDPTEKVRFASLEIWVWGNAFLKNKQIDSEDLKRMISVGLPKDYSEGSVAKPGIDRRKYRTVITVCENLHWSRYSDEYRKLFLDDLRFSAGENQDVLFLIKPHHDERWLARHPMRDSLPNVLLADPQDPFWQPFTAPSFIAVSDAVITTPSTVALDAAMMNKPAAVAAYGLDLNSYQPLFFLRSRRDWGDIINFSDRQDMFLDAGKRFRSIWIDENNAVENILKRLEAFQNHV